jgi:vacuolar-type H+-ATPase subunit D/Vma8
MKQDVYELKNALQDHKNRLRLAQIALELMENNYDELKGHRDEILKDLENAKRELARMKRLYEPKSQCANCSGGCVASEINGKVCSPR